MFKKNLVIYHANCMDGFAAAWAAWTKLGDKDTAYIACNYGDFPALQHYYDAIYIVDFSFSRELLVELCKSATTVVVLDHHKTAQEALSDWKDAPDCCHIYFDMTRSGAMMAWDHFRQLDDVPALISYVQDRDLWQKRLPHSEAISAFISTLPHNFDSWTAASHLIRNRFNEAKNIGEAVLRKHQQTVGDIVKLARPIKFHHAGEGVSGLAANCTGHFASDVGDELCKLSGTFGAPYFSGPDGSVKWSLRSEGDFDVAAIAKLFGGGGHKNAAGFTLKESGRDYEAEINIWVGEGNAENS